MENGFDYISNDRVILEAPPEANELMAHGLPKLPRVNPGTLIAGARTRGLMDPEAVGRYQGLSKTELWQVEDKYDVPVEKVLGRRWLLAGGLACAFVLDWKHGDGPLELHRLTPGQALEELRAVRKSFGPFDLRLSERRDTALIETAQRVPIYRVTGNTDPEGLAGELAGGRLGDLT
jgi:HprK-related kinase B